MTPLAPSEGSGPRSDADSAHLVTCQPVEVAYTAPQRVHDIIASLGRTEDLRFSPNGRRLAVASAVHNRVVIIDVDISRSGSGAQVSLPDTVEISSSCLHYPHGLDFVDDETLVIANRRGGVSLFRLPAAGTVAPSREAAPIRVLGAGETPLMRTPGSIAILARDQRHCEMLVCNNLAHNVTRHVLDPAAQYALEGSEILLENWLSIPDGISVSADRQWIAVSNHNMHCVMLYENRSSLDRHAGPDGILRGAHSPHGLRFGRDGRHVFVADAGAPYVHIYARGERGWGGVRHPIASIRVMDEPTFLRGRYNSREGGPKGIDLDHGMNVLVATSEWRPLAFFDLPAMLETAHGGAHLPALNWAADAEREFEQSHAAWPDPRAAAIRQAVHYELNALMPLKDLYQRLHAAEARARRVGATRRRAKAWLVRIGKSAYAWIATMLRRMPRH